MSFNAVFYTFSKRENSTAQPSGTGTTLSVELKDNSSVVEPILRLHNTANWNPSDLNYCYINKFSRYYWVVDWEYSLGEWNCYLKSDPLASFKSGIGNLSKYVLRSAYTDNADIVDDFYPLLAKRPTSRYTDSYQYWANNSLADGTFILGIANQVQSNTGAICYYIMNNVQMYNLISYMLPQTSDLWTNGFTGMNDMLYRAMYSPFDYIKVCKWYPFTIIDSGLTRDYVRFGNYESNVQAAVIPSNFSDWERYNHRYSLPSDWLDRKAKYRTNPNCRLYFRMNPWGVIELNPMDFSNTIYMKAYIDIDYITGDSMLRLYKERAGTEEFIYQQVAKLGVDIQLTASSMNFMGLLQGIAGGVASVAGAFLGNPLPSLLTMGGFSYANMAQSSTPTMDASKGQQTGSPSFLEGTSDLILVSPMYAGENIAEFGRPLYDTRTLSTIPGYIKCADTECDAIGGMYINERNEVGQHLLNGFFYE